MSLDIPPSEGLDREVETTLKRLRRFATICAGVAILLVATALGLAAAREISAWVP